ncbi:hypothetical protein Cma02nite_21320 [Cellulomonas marina]|uniref:LacI family transcriptional regulator n=1 Tax=Cellulomonas marina TaxID=988821 RepID=A0A1I0XAD0_9CELL|nr:hypothetical protein Cma02nite_21320 [Cellulomonas marina]SFA97627.1 LacI family transcriptional regulator [Cellulomonas marina]
MAGRAADGRSTLADVAGAARVSTATMSKTLYERQDVAASMRERVLAAVASLGYRSSTQPSPESARRAVAVVFDIPASPLS